MFNIFKFFNLHFLFFFNLFNILYPRNIFNKLYFKPLRLKNNFYYTSIKLNNFLIYTFSNNFLNTKNKSLIFRIFFKSNFFKKTFFKNFLKYRNYFYLNGLNSLFTLLKFLIIPLFLLTVIVYYTYIVKLLPFNKILMAWISIIMFIYWLISGFVFFFKKYQFGKYTSVIQRFWKRSYILFWLIEGSTFGVFLFLTINASQEPFYMFDQISIFKSHLYSWKFFFLKIFPVTLLVIFLFLLLLSIKYNTYYKYSIFLCILTFFITNLVWLEFYQFYHIINFFSNLNWFYDLEENFWFLEQEPRRTRIVNNYVMFLFILKFWHIMFIYGVWIFFVLRCYETKRIRYSLLSANYQNIIILYIFVWIFMYPWFKFFFKNVLESPYYWFYVNNRKLFFRIILNDFKLFFYNFYSNLIYFGKKFNNFNFYYFMLNNQTNYEGFKKTPVVYNFLKTVTI